MYQYDTTLNDIIVRETGATTRSLFAADAESRYILQLEEGLLDHETAITGVAETHDIRQRDMAYIFGVDIDPNYSTSTMPAYTITLTDNDGKTNEYTMTPTASDNVREHHIGTRMNRPVSIRAKVAIESTKADELVALALGYMGK